MLIWTFGLAHAAAPCLPADAPAWLAGTWTATTGPTVLVEHWEPPRGGHMLGTGQTLQDRTDGSQKTVFFEFMAILPDAQGCLGLEAWPGGGPQVRFPLVSAEAGQVVFENPAHDHPQRIRYAREGTALRVEIGDLAGVRTQRWTHHLLSPETPARPATAPPTDAPTGASARP